MTQIEEQYRIIVMQAQTQGIDVFGILSKREIQFLNGLFVPNANYARQLRLCIKRKLAKALGNPNSDARRILKAQGINVLNTHDFMPKTAGISQEMPKAPRRECGRR